MSTNEVAKNNDSQKMGLLGSTSFIVGSVIGAGIFVISGSLAGELGAGMFICYILGLIPAMGQGLTYAQLGSAIPVTSGQYSYMCKFLHPSVGFFFNWGTLLAACSITGSVCKGITGYMAYWFPDVPELVFSLGILTFFTLVHIMGMKSVEITQTIMVVVMVVVLVMFIVLGVPHMKPELSEPLFPNGTGTLIASAATLYFSYLGFNAVTDIGEDIKNPSRNIPLSIILAGGVVGFIYIGVAYVMPRLIPYTELAANNVGIADAAATFFPAFGMAIRIAAIFAILTSVSACVAQDSRLWFVMGRDGWMFTKALGYKNSKGAPVGGILALYIFTALLLITGLQLTYIATMGSLALLLGTAVVAWFPVIMPKKFPEEYEKASFKLPMGVKVAIAAITCITCLVLAFSTMNGFMIIWLFIAAWMVPGAFVYIRGRKRGLQ